MNREEKRALLAKYKAPPDLTLPKSGLIVEVRRPPLARWIAAGEVPESIFNSAAAALNTGKTAAAIKELPEVFALAIKIAHASFVWPKPIGEGEQEDEDSVDPTSLPVEDLTFVLEWAMSGSTNVPVKTSSGEVSVEALHSFRPVIDIQSDSTSNADVQQERVGVAGNS